MKMNLEDILINHVAGEKLSADEERLVDRVLYEKTGQRFGRFKGKKPKAAPEITTISANQEFKRTLELSGPPVSIEPIAPPSGAQDVS